MEDITVIELAQRLKNGDAPAVIDVREPIEYAYARIEGAHLKPLDEIMQWSQELDPDREYVMVCHVGERSAFAALILRRMGFERVRNLIGGIDAWSVHVDPGVPRY
ncbi:MAG TPA: rhodanese-like domain-containing protein [Anaerolineae bacterium]|nr:rhodanese-like domain-containing protein [Anaerolineae bacterium]